MFYFNPISYFFKSFIRLFTKKFFWVILILLIVSIGWALYDKGVFAETNIIIDDSGITDTIIQDARTRIGEDIWNNTDYDIFIFFWGQIYSNTSKTNYNLGYCYSYFNTADYSDISNYKLTSFNSNYSYGGISFVRSVLTTRDLNNNTINVLHYWRNIYGSSNLIGSDYETTPWLGDICSMPSGTTKLWLKAIRSHYDILDNNNELVLSKNVNIEPFIENESSTINNWSFDYLHINSGTQTIYYDNVLGEETTASLYLDYVYNDIRYRYQIPSNLYSINTDNTFDIYIPRTSLLNNVNITNGSNVSFYLGVRKNTESVFPLGNYTFSLTTEEQEQIQQDSDKALQGEILGAQQETNNKLDSIENTITDTTIPDDSEFDLPTIEVNDSTANFFDTLFTGIYNAFNTNEDTSISFTIFSKTITINSADFRMLNDNRFTILRNLLESSWYFAIGYMVLKDIRHIFDKIKTGNIENAVSNDIKADMV